MDATLLVDVILMRGNKLSYISRWIGQTIPRNRTQKYRYVKRNKLKTMHTIDNIIPGIKYLVLYVLFHTMPTIQKQSKHFRSLSAWYIIKWKIEDFSETHLCKLRGIFRSRVLRVYNLAAVELTQWTYKSVTVDRYVTLLVDVICMYATILVDVICMRGGKWSYITRWIGQAIARNRTKKYEWGMEGL